MRKSISKLIVAGLALAMVLPMSVNAQTAKKASPRAVVQEASAVTAKAKPAQKFNTSKLVLTRAQAKANANPQLASVKPFHHKSNMTAISSSMFRAPARATAATSVYGIITYSNDDIPFGLYSFPVDGSSTEFSYIATPDALFCSAGCVVDGVLYTTGIDIFLGMIFGAYNVAYDAETMEMLEIVENVDLEDFSNQALSMAYDATTDKVYGCFYTADLDGFNFCEYDINTFTVTPIATLLESWDACGFSADGTLYVVTKSGTFCKVDKASGAMTQISNLGVTPQYLGSGTLEAQTGRFFWNLNPSSGSYMVEIDITTGTPTILYELEGEEQIQAMWIPAPAAEDGAPAAAEITADFAEGALEGTVTFVAPDKTFNGDALTGDLEYTLTANGEVVAEGTVAPGATVVTDYTATEAGTYKFVVTTSNAAGHSPKASVELYIGMDKPQGPANVDLDRDGDTMILTWDAVTAGINNGFVGDVKYDVVRYTNDAAEIVAEGISECQFTEEIAEPMDITSIYYTVTAVASGVESVSVASNPVVLGSVRPPYTQQFDSEEALDGYTIIDANGDDRTWTFYSEDKGVYIRYNSSQDMDDWLVTPPVVLEAGNVYEVAIEVASNSTVYQERVEVKAGTKLTPAAFTIDVIEPTDLKTASEFITLKGMLVANESGKYYIGIHGCSDADMFYMYCKGISISAGASAKAPSAVEDFTVTPDAMGGRTAEVSFTVPTTDISGNELTDITVVRVYRNGELVNNFLNVEPGQEISFTDVIPEDGDYTYTIVVENAYGTGMEATQTVYIGVPAPAAPYAAWITENDTPGNVTIHWEAVDESATGGYLNPSNVTYNVYNSDFEIIAEGISETEFTLQAIDPETQDFVYFFVEAVTVGGVSPSITPTKMVPVGKPYTLPFEEPFADGTLTHIWGLDSSGGGSAGLYTDDDLGLPDADGTNGCAALTGSSLGASSQLFTGKINLDVDEPVLSFQYYAIADDDENVLSVMINCEGVTYPLKSIVQNEGVIGAWNLVSIPLNDFAGKNIQVVFENVVYAYTYTLIDDVCIDQPKDFDLRMKEVVGSTAKVKPGQNFTISATVFSKGAKVTMGYTIELYHNGELVATQGGRPISTGKSITYTFDQTLGVTAPEENIYKAVVVSDKDEKTDDNEGEYSVIVVFPNYPTPTDLEAAVSEGGVALTWAEPEIEVNEGGSPVIEAVTEDFESYTPWSTTDLGDWTLIDADGGSIGGIEGITIPVSACAYFVMNNEGENFNQSFDAHSGVQYLSTMYNGDGSQQSDWLISPVLCGQAQTISFFARSYTDQYGLESLKVYYSTTDSDIASFVEVDASQVPAEWTEFQFDVPEGAVYFAIECTSADVFMLFIDDVTYIPADGNSIELSLVGYNIYRNGEKINEALVEETEYVDADGKEGDEYVVTAVYTIGESKPSNVASLPSSIFDMTIGTAVKVQGRTIVVKATEGNVAIYAADGKAIYNEAANGNNTITVVPGVYVVKNGKLNQKVVVK